MLHSHVGECGCGLGRAVCTRGGAERAQNPQSEEGWRGVCWHAKHAVSQAWGFWRTPKTRTAFPFDSLRCTGRPGSVGVPCTGFPPNAKLYSTALYVLHFLCCSLYSFIVFLRSDFPLTRPGLDSTATHPEPPSAICAAQPASTSSPAPRHRKLFAAIPNTKREGAGSGSRAAGGGGDAPRGRQRSGA